MLAARSNLPPSAPIDNTAAMSAVETLAALVSSDFASTKHLIMERVNSDDNTVQAIAQHLITAGGKALRALLMLNAAHLCHYQGQHHIALAAAIEFMHAATLLHDDVVDESTMRRGESAARTVWGNKASILVGDYLISKAFRLMVETESPPALDLLSQTAMMIAEGEVMQLSINGTGRASEADYLNIIDAKTAALFAAACCLGGLIAGSPKTHCQALNDYGRALGMVFQITDDALDYQGDAAITGKSIGNDFYQGKITYPIILALRHADEDERRFWHQMITKPSRNRDDFSHAVELIHRHGALEGTLAQAHHYASQARSALRSLPSGAHRDALADTIDFCVKRNH